MRTRGRTSSGPVRVYNPHMKITKTILGVIFCVASTALVSPAIGAQRSFAQTYEYQTMQKGTGIYEYYLAVAAPSDGFAGRAVNQHQFALTVGMTDKFDVGIFQSFSQASGTGLAYDGFRLRARYRIADEGTLPVDTAFIIERAEDPEFSAHNYGMKLVVAHDFGPVFLAANPSLVVVKNSKWEANPGYAVGLGWRAASLLSISVETHGDKHNMYVGPVIAHGNQSFRVVIGSSLRCSGSDAHGPKTAVSMMTGVAF